MLLSRLPYRDALLADKRYQIEFHPPVAVVLYILEINRLGPVVEIGQPVIRCDCCLDTVCDRGSHVVRILRKDHVPETVEVDEIKPAPRRKVRLALKGQNGTGESFHHLPSRRSARGRIV